MENTCFVDLYDIIATLAEGTSYEVSEIFNGVLSLLSDGPNSVGFGDPDSLTLVRADRVKKIVLEMFEEESRDELNAVRAAWDLNIRYDGWVAIG